MKRGATRGGVGGVVERLRLIFRAKKKDDRVDVEKLAKLLFLGEVPEIHVPQRDVRAWRSLIGSRTRTKNAIRALLRELGCIPPYRLWTKRGVARLEALEITDATDALRRDVLIDELRYKEALVGRGVARSGVGNLTATTEGGRRADRPDPDRGTWRTAFGQAAAFMTGAGRELYFMALPLG